MMRKPQAESARSIDPVLFVNIEEYTHYTHAHFKFQLLSVHRSVEFREGEGEKDPCPRLRVPTRNAGVSRP